MVPATVQEMLRAPYGLEDAEFGDPALPTVRQAVGQLLAALNTPWKAHERRGQPRIPYPALMYVTPVADRDTSPIAERSVGVCKDISESGLGFFHPQPLPHRRVVVSLKLVSDEWRHFLLDLRWCRFTLHGWYESGGRFIQMVDEPWA